MGFLSSLFGKDWSAELERIERDLANDDPVLALDRARKAAKGAPEGPLRERAEALVELACAAAVARSLARAQQAETAGEWADAADWIGAALANEADPQRRSELETRRAKLLEELDRGDTPFAARKAAAASEPAEDDDDGELDAHDSLWEAWLATLNDEVVERWEGRPADFEAAVVAINDGRGAEAIAALDALIERAPDDVVLRFERGRARLASGDSAGALEDLECAWEELGDAPLDGAGAVSLPAMWAEAKLSLGEESAAGEVVERLESLADARGAGGLEPALLYAHAVAEVGRLDEADQLLARAERVAPRESRITLERAGIQARAGRRRDAIALLEAAVLPTCRPGCATPPHLPSMRALAALHLEEGDDPERARELVVFVAHRNGGALAAVDHELLARYYDKVGNSDAAAEAREEARALAGVDVDAVSPLLVPGGRRRVL